MHTIAFLKFYKLQIYLTIPVILLLLNLKILNLYSFQLFQSSDTLPQEYLPNIYGFYP